jgi:large subunit ribosomal protein L20
MPRVKRGVPAHKRHKKVLNLTEGHRGAKRLLFRPAHESMMKSLAYAFRDRRNRKRDMRRLWITRINAAARLHNLTYSQLIHGLSLANITVDRKMMADMAVRDDTVFAELVSRAAAALGTNA